MTNIDDPSVIDLQGSFSKNTSFGVLRDYPIAVFQDQRQVLALAPGPIRWSHVVA